MLDRLQIKNYVLINSLEIDFPAGLVIITGQTGAGKSILLGAFSLVLGGKSDAGMIGPNGNTCVVEAEFNLPGDDAARKIVEEADLEWNGGCLVLRRVLTRGGRARAFLNDLPVKVAVLQNLSKNLLDIHSQNETMLLSDKRFRLSALDYFTGNGELLTEYSELWHSAAVRRRELNDITEKLAKIALERDFNASLLKTLEEVNLRDGEMEELETEQKQLANADEIKSSLTEVEKLLSPEGDESMSVDDILREAVKRLGDVAEYVDSDSLSERLESCRLEIEDVLSSVCDIEEGINVSPQRLTAVEERMSDIYSLFTKHGCRTVAELIEIRDALSKSAVDSTLLEQRQSDLKKVIEKDNARINLLANRLTGIRKTAAPKFAHAITGLLASLELEHASFEVNIEDRELSSDGRDDVTFLFSATGNNPVEVSKCASGGEKSRIMLCLKYMMARFADMPTMIFDEIDTGVSGSVADKMGSMICAMGDYMQVFAITHLPQVAAKGRAHFVVRKKIDPKDGTAVSTIVNVEGDDRIREIARMLSGSDITEEAVANARSLLGV